MGRLRVPTITAADLVVSKLLAGRPKDIEDVRGILAQQAGKLDARHIRTLLRDIEQAIDQSDLVSLFETLQRERKPARTPADRKRRA